jgi:hypothetical protein
MRSGNHACNKFIVYSATIRPQLGIALQMGLLNSLPIVCAARALWCITVRVSHMRFDDLQLRRRRQVTSKAIETTPNFPWSRAAS